MSWTVHEIARYTGGDATIGADTVVRGFAIDSRQLEPGQCFVALRGNRDGHDFVADAFAAGAAAALVARRADDPLIPTDAPLVVVPDPLAALGSLAAVRRDQLGATVVAVTGSVGKTATKDFVTAALAADRSVHASSGSLNNEAGLPLTLLDAPTEVSTVVVEMGARFAGDIRHLASIARPDVGVVTNVGLAHAEHLGGPEATARVKGELVESLRPDGVAVLNADDEWTPTLAARCEAEIVTAGRSAGADVRIVTTTLDDELRATMQLATPWGDLSARLPLRGAHQVLNASLAAAVALRLGCSSAAVARGLAAARPSAWRMQLDRSPEGLTVLNDSYNANPMSVAAALHALRSLPAEGRRVAVLGPMLELGAHTEREHEAVGHRVAVSADVLVAVGEEAAAIARAAKESGLDDVVEVGTAAAALSTLLGRVGAGDVVLVKASRAAGLEMVASGLVEADGAGGRAQ